MKRTLTTIALLAACAAASAANYTFDFTTLTPTSFRACTGADRCGDPLTFLSGVNGLTVSVKGFYKNKDAGAIVVQDYNSNGTFVGLGVYHTSPFDPSDDNITKNEYLTLTFSQAVTLKSLNFRSDGHGTSFAASSTFALDGVSMLLGSSVTGLSSYGQTFKVAYGGNKPVQNYLSGMMVSAVPEPESYAMMIVGLGLMGAIVRRRKAKAA